MWKLNGQLIKKDERIHATESVNGSTLVMKTVNRKDTGKVECQALNAIGVDSRHAFLMITGINAKKRFRYIVPTCGSDTMKLTWSDARKHCLSIKGDLASIANAKEQKLIQDVVNRLKKNEEFWIGANDLEKERRFQWSDGTPFLFTKWWRGEPNNRGSRGSEDCVHLKKRGYGRFWNDLACRFKHAFVCKIPN